MIVLRRVSAKRAPVRDISHALAQRFPPECTLSPGPGTYSIGWQWRQDHYALFVLDERGGGDAVEVDVPHSGQYPWRCVFSPRGDRVLLYACSVLREVDLARATLRPHAIYIGGIPSAAALLEDGNIAIAYRNDAIHTEGGGGAVAVLAHSGEVLWQEQLDADELQVLHGDRVWAVRRRVDPERAVRPGQWRTMLLAYRRGELRELCAIAEDTGPLREDGSALVGERGIRVERLDAALVRAFSEGASDARGISSTRRRKCAQVDGIALPMLPRVAGVVWERKAFERVLPLRSRNFGCAALARVTVQEVWQDVDRWVRSDSVWRRAGEAGALESAVLKRYRSGCWPPRPHDAQLEGATLAMMDVPPPAVTARLVTWWADAAGIDFAIEALLAAWRFRVDRGEQGRELVCIGWPDDNCSGDLIHHHPILGAAGALALPRVPWLVLRHHLCALSRNDYERLHAKVRRERRDAPLPLRIMFSALFGESRWVRRDSEACLATRAPLSVGPLLAAVQDIDLAEQLCRQYAGSPSVYAYLLELVATFGAESVRLLRPLCEATVAQRRWDRDRVGVLLDVLELIPSPEAVTLLIPFLAEERYRVRIRRHLERKAPSAVQALLRSRSDTGSHSARELLAMLAVGKGTAASRSAVGALPPSQYARVYYTSSGLSSGGSSGASSRAGAKLGAVAHQDAHRRLAWAHDAWRQSWPPRAEHPRLDPAAPSDIARMHAKICSEYRRHRDLFARSANAELWLSEQDKLWAPHSKGQPVAQLTKSSGPSASPDPAALGDAIALMGPNLERFVRGGVNQVLGLGATIVRYGLAVAGGGCVLEALAHAWYRLRTTEGNRHSMELSTIGLANCDEGKGAVGFEGNSGLWDLLRAYLRQVDGTRYNECRKLADRLRGQASFPLRCALGFVFDEPRWHQSDLGALVGPGVADLRWLALRLLPLCRDAKLVLGVIDADAKTSDLPHADVAYTDVACTQQGEPVHTSGRAMVTAAQSSLWQSSFEFVQALGQDALPVLQKLLARIDDEGWSEQHARVFTAIATIQTPAAFALLLPLAELGHPESWELLAAYTLRGDGTAIVPNIVRAQHLSEKLRPLVALGIGRKPKQWRSAIEKLQASPLKTELVALAGAVNADAGVAKRPPRQLAERRLAPIGRRTFLSPELLPRVQLAGSREVLPDGSVTRLLAALRKAPEQGDFEPQLDSLRDALDTASRIEFARALSSAWNNAGAHRGSRWVLRAAAFLVGPTSPQLVACHEGSAS